MNVRADPRSLVERAIRNTGRLSHDAKPRWSHVADVFAVGSSHATELCKEFGSDPDEIVGNQFEAPDG